MRAIVLLALLSATGSEPSLHDIYQQKFDDACRALGGVRQVWYDVDAAHAECSQGMKITLYAVHEAQ
jgi:hypothetical protein